MYLRMAEVAELLRVRPATVQKWVRQGLLPAVRIGRTVRIRREAVEQLGKQ